MSEYTREQGPLGPYSPPLDEGIAEAVHILNEAGIVTHESCQGGEGHLAGCDNLPEPFISFNGTWRDGFMALALFMGNPQYRVAELRRVWRMIDGEPEGPTWVLTFAPIGQQR